MSYPTFGISCVLIFFVGFALFGSSALLPLMVQMEFGYDATLAGLVISPGGLTLIFLMPIVGRLVNLIQARYLIAFGTLMVSIGMWYTGHITPQTDYNSFVMMRILQVVGLPFLFVPISTQAFSQISKEKSGKASALYSLLRNLGGSVGISIMANYVVRHRQMHQPYLAEHLSPLNDAYKAAVAHGTEVMASMGNVNAAGAVMGRMYQQLLRQSSLMAYNDAFRLIAAILLFLVFLGLMMPPNKVGKKPPTEEAVALH